MPAVIRLLSDGRANPRGSPRQGLVPAGGPHPRHGQGHGLLRGAPVGRRWGHVPRGMQVALIELTLLYTHVLT